MQQAMDRVVASLKSKNDSEDACSGPDLELTANCSGCIEVCVTQAMGAAARTSPKADAKATAITAVGPWGLMQVLRSSC